MADDNNLSKDNKNNSNYNYWKDQRDQDSQTNEGGQKNEETGEYRYSNVSSYKHEDNNYNNYSYNNYDESNYNNNQYNSSNQHGSGSYNSKDNNKQKKPSKIKRFFGFVSKAIAFGLIVAITFIGANEVIYRINPNLNNGSSLIDDNKDKFTIEQTAIIGKSIEDTDVTKVVESTMPSIVTITGTFTETYNFFGQRIDEEKPGSGSGFIIDRNDTELLIATNNHVVEGAKPIEVTFIDGESAEAIIKGTDVDADLAVIAVDLANLSEETKNSIQIADTLEDGEVKVGEKAVAIGNALGIGQSVTVGYVSAVDREVNLGNNVMTLLQTDAAINPGNSGGPLLNINGQVIGINTVKFADYDVEGMGYAIPIYRAMPILNELKGREVLPDGEKGHLGVYIQDITEDLAEMFNWPVGVYVSDTTEGGPANEAGILKGDIIVGLNDIEVTSTTQLIEKVTSYRASTEVTVRLMRNNDGIYEEIEVQVTLGRNPNMQ